MKVSFVWPSPKSSKVITSYTSSMASCSIPYSAGSTLFPSESEKYMEETIFSCRTISWYSPAFQPSCPSGALMQQRNFPPTVVYAKPAFGGPLQVLRYLGRYTHRVAISNHRLLAFEQERVTFRWKDNAHGGKPSQMTLAATEFLRRFFLHVLPKGFVRIRHFGFLANRFRVSRLELGRQLLASSSSIPQEVR